MRWIWPLLTIILFAIGAKAQVAAISGSCIVGAVQAQTQGLKSSNFQQGVIPNCTVTVYLTGTTNLATIFSDGSSTPLGNPFTLIGNKSSWLFFATINQGYDVVMSGGTPPNTFSSPVTLVGLYPAQQITGVIGPPGPAGPPGPPGSGDIIPSTQFSLFYQPNSGTDAAAQGDPNITTDGSGHMQALSVNSNVQNAINIAAPPYNARGDCSVNGSSAGCTDNCTRIQNAIDAAYSAGGAIFIPVSSTHPSIYYTSCALNPKGVSIYAPPGMGNRSSGNFWPLVGVRGAPGLDIFNVIDPTAVGYVTPIPNYNIQDFGLIVDDSVDVSTTINGGHRKPGRTCSDVTATNGSAIITSAGTSKCMFNPGDVGQNVTLTDGTNTLATTIDTVSNADASGSGTNNATLANVWPFTTHTNSTLYIAIMTQTTARRVGNCAFAYDDFTGAGTNGPNQAVFRNLEIVTTSQTSTTNNSCTFFFQGVGGQVYASRFDNIFTRTVWGPVAVGADAPSHGTNGAWGDNNEINNVFFESNYPLVTYGGKRTHWHGGQMAFACWGPQILEFASPNTATTVGLWQLDRMEYEVQGCTLGSAGGWRIEGTDHVLTNAAISIASVNTPTQWDAFLSKCLSCTTGGVTNVAGWLNQLQFIDNPDTITVNDTGFGNLCSTGRSFGPLDGAEPSLFRACSAVNSRQNIAFAHTGDFVGNGNETTQFNNQADLWIWPQDLYPSNGSNARLGIVADSSSETGTHLAVAAQTSYGALNGRNLVFGLNNTGPNIPLTKVRMCGKMKLESGSGVVILSLRANNVVQGSVSPTLTTAYSTNCFDADLTADNGQTPTIVINPAAAGTIDVAWLSVHPWSDYENIIGTLSAGQLVDTGVAASTKALALNGSNQVIAATLAGSGAALTTGPATGTVAGHIATFVGTNGQIQDGGSPAPSPIVATVPLATYSGTTTTNPTFFTTPNDGTQHQYQMCGWGIVTVAGTAGTFTEQVQFTVNGAVAGFYLGQSAGAGVSITTIGNSPSATVPNCTSIVADPNTAVKWAIVMTGVTGTPTVQYTFTLTQLQ